MLNIPPLISSEKKENTLLRTSQYHCRNSRHRFRREHHYYLLHIGKRRSLYGFRSRIAKFYRMFQERWQGKWLWSPGTHSSAELSPGKKRAGAADEAADRERQMMLTSSRNPGLEQVLPEWSCPAGSTASHRAKGTFHEHKCPFLSEALQQRENR